MQRRAVRPSHSSRHPPSSLSEHGPVSRGLCEVGGGGLLKSMEEHTVIEKKGALLNELVRLLEQAQELCEKHHASYTDYLDRVLALPKPSADAAV